MTDGHFDDQQDNRPALNVEVGGQKIQADQKTAQTLIQATIPEWRLVVRAFAWLVFFVGTCWGISLLWKP